MKTSPGLAVRNFLQILPRNERLAAAQTGGERIGDEAIANPSVNPLALVMDGGELRCRQRRRMLGKNVGSNRLGVRSNGVFLMLMRDHRRRCRDFPLEAIIAAPVAIARNRNFFPVALDDIRLASPLSNADWKSPTDPDARIAKMKDGTTHLAYKPEHAVDLDTGVVVAAPIHPADEGDTTTLSPTLDAAARNLDAVGLAPSEDAPCVVVADKGYHAREQLKALEDGVWKTRIAEPEPAKGYLRWHGDEAARKAVYANRVRLRSDVGRATMRRRGELVERSFAHILDRRGMRRAWLRGRENLHKRYLIHVAGFNLGVLMRALYEGGRRWPARGTPQKGGERAYKGGLRKDRSPGESCLSIAGAKYASPPEASVHRGTGRPSPRAESGP